MSYSSGVLDLNPFFYFPMDVKNGLIPLDLQEQVIPEISGDYGYDLSTEFFSDPIELPPGSFFILNASEDFFSEQATYSLWASSDLVEDNVDIFSIQSGSQGLGLSYSTENSKFILNFYSGQTLDFELPFNEPRLFTITVSSGDINFYIDNELIFSSTNFTIPSEPEIVVGSLSSFQGNGSLRASDLFYVQSEISMLEVNNIYNLGYNGYEVFKLDSPSSMTISDVNNTFLQTAWQAYGEVTTKK